MKDWSYVGVGKIYIREYGAAAPLVEIGNCSALNLAPQVEQKELPNYNEQGGGLQNSFERVKGVDVSYSFHDFSPDNLARALRGTNTVVAAGTATAEEVVAYKGGFTPLSKIATAITTVTNMAGGTTYVAGTDYIVVDGGIEVLSTGTIANPVAGAANIKVTYTYAAQNRVQAMINAAKQYQMIFVGLNEAQSGKRHRLTIHKVTGGTLQNMAMIGEDYGVGEVTGKCLIDTSITGAGLSKYFFDDIEE